MASSAAQGIAQQFDQATQRELATFLETENAKALLQQSIHTFTDRCWDKCMTGKLGNSLARSEETCLQNCVERFLDTSQAVVQALQNQSARH